MKIKVKCDSCSRVHLITITEQKEMMRLECLNCGKIIKYRIPEKKLNNKDDDAINTLLNMFKMKK